MRFLYWIPAMLFAHAVFGAPSVQVKAIRAWSFTGITRVAIELDRDFRVQSDRAHNPERLFFDLSAADRHTPAERSHGKLFARKEVGDRLLKRVRIAETQPGVTRIVLDLESPSDFSASQLASPNRLIIELHAAGGSGPPSPVSRTAPPDPTRIAKVPDTNIPIATQVTDTSPVTTPPNFAANEQPEIKIPNPPAVRPSTAGSAAREAHLEVTRSLTRALGLKVNRIVIDAGHGGHDQGTSGPGGLLEKDLVLDVALRLGKLIEQRLGAEVIYTRSDDTFIPLTERTAIANRSHADLFLSIHANSSVAHEVAGVETYYLNFTNSPEAMELAARENASSEKSVYELKDLIQRISLHDKIEESRQFAECVQTSMQNFTARSFPSARNRGIRKAPFVVLIGASMPSILAEIGFLTNPKQEGLLERPEYRQRLAEALLRGLDGYTKTLSHFEVARR